MICFPNAKINLGLHIVSKREDGYHNIETIFYPIDLCDALEIVPARGEKGVFTQTGMPVDGNSGDNLVIKAYNLLRQQYSFPETDIYLRKNIPMGAGLGGGSADAAFMLKLINDYAGLNLSINQLEQLAAQLGADCPFFIQNQPVFAEGIGTIFTPVNLSLKGYYMALIKPDIHVSTKEAYANVKPQRPANDLRDCIRKPVETWKDLLFNDFEPGIFAKYPGIQETKEKLYNAGALYASMSGSGSSVFGIFNVKPVLPEAYILHLK